MLKKVVELKQSKKNIINGIMMEKDLLYQMIKKKIKVNKRAILKKLQIGFNNKKC